jgi:hypothetical protein
MVQFIMAAAVVAEAAAVAHKLQQVAQLVAENHQAVQALQIQAVAVQVAVVVVVVLTVEMVVQVL